MKLVSVWSTVTVLHFLVAPWAIAAPGQVDTSFADQGIATLRIGA